MLSHNAKDRPSAEEALKHPYLQSEKQQFEMLCKIGNQCEIKTQDANSDVVRKLNSIPSSWKSLLKHDVLTYLSTVCISGKKYNYSSSWTVYGLSEMSRNTGATDPFYNPKYTMLLAIRKDFSWKPFQIFLLRYTELSGRAIGKNDLTSRSTSLKVQ